MLLVQNEKSIIIFGITLAFVLGFLTILLINTPSEKILYGENENKFYSDAKKIDKTEGQLNWNDNAPNIIGKINGLFPFPGAFFNFKGQRYKVLKAEIGNGEGKTGEVLSDKLEIACKDNQSVKILEIQRQGKRAQKISEFMLGSQIKKGSKLLNV